MYSRVRTTVAVLSVLVGAACADGDRQTLIAPNRTPSAEVIDGAASGTVIPGGDYAGADLTPADGATLSGAFTNVGKFTIAAGTHVYVASGIPLSIGAGSVDIEGVLDATGAGYAGGSLIWYATNFQPGQPGAGFGGGLGSGFGGCHQSAGGGGGGNGGRGGGGGQVIQTTPEALGGFNYGVGLSFLNNNSALGSGGGSAGTQCFGLYNVLLGVGGAGGGAIAVVAPGDFVVNGSLIADGAAGVSGAAPPLCCEFDDGFNTSGGGGGSGGGVFLSGHLTFGPAAVLSAKGGAGGAIIPALPKVKTSGWGWAIPGGGGGGGHVGLYGCATTPLPTITVDGGAAGADGSPGHLALISMSKPGQPGVIDHQPVDQAAECSLPDVTPPTIIPTVSGTLSATGWYTSAVTVHWDVSDAESKVTSFFHCEDFPIKADSPQGTYTCVAQSSGGRAQRSVTIKVDQTPPVVVPEVFGTLGNNGWYTSNVFVRFKASDPISGVQQFQNTGLPCDTELLVSDHTDTTITCTATNGAGLQTTAQQIVKRDASPPLLTPTVSGTLGNNGWYTSDVTVSWAASDPTSGAPAVPCAANALTSDNAGTTFTCSATNGAGLQTTMQKSVKRDATPASITFIGNAGNYTVDQTVSITCAANDALSGLASSTCAPISGEGYTFPVGTNTYRASATDVAGNVGFASASFTMSVTNDAVCHLVQRWASNAGVANSLCTKLVKRNNDPFRNELAAQTGNGITAANAAILTQLVNALDSQ
jgi:hypothetical protein